MRPTEICKIWFKEQRHQNNVCLEISTHLAQNAHRAMVMKENQHQKVESPK